ncbi:MAG: PTS mannose transporter subunit IIA [Thiotrichales bacterium]|nr:MAG: PTS mannose transporter subunit IIA [Thiotrichales bacterium]
MSVALLLVTHNNIGKDMLMITSSILNDELNNVAYVEVPMDADVDSIRNKVSAELAKLATDNGLLILTDSYGSTPCNIAYDFLDADNRILISGLNLPMLIRIMNYRSLPLDELKDIAVEGGKHGIVSRTN